MVEVGKIYDVLEMNLCLSSFTLSIGILFYDIKYKLSSNQVYLTRLSQG